MRTGTDTRRRETRAVCTEPADHRQCAGGGSFISIPLLGAWFGMLAGLLELGVIGLLIATAGTPLVGGRVVFRGLNHLWMAPLAGALYFSVAGVAFLTARRRWPREWIERAAIFAFTFLAFYSGMRTLTLRLHLIAVVLLCAGAAAAVSRLSIVVRPAFTVFVRRTAVAMLALIMAAAGTTLVGTAVMESRAVASLPRPPAGAPNVLLVVMDTVRAKSLDLNDPRGARSPNLARLAAAGVRFEHAVAPAPWTLATHASLFTGRDAHQLSADFEQPLDGTYPTLAEAFSEAGYRTGGFVANLGYCSRTTGLARGFTHYEDHPLSAATVATSTYFGASLSKHCLKWSNGRIRLRHKTAERINADFLRWLDDGPEHGRPFFAFLNYFDAHSPYVPPEPWNSLGESAPARPPWVVSGRRYQADEVRALNRAYDRSIQYLDHQIGALLDELETRGTLENTLVIVTADHGEQFGEHGLADHGNSLYRALLHVPLVMSFPSRLPAGKCVNEPVALRDVAATVGDVLGLDPLKRLPGASLSGFWEPHRADSQVQASPILAELRAVRNSPEWHPIAKGAMRSCVLGGFQYIRNGDGREELFDFLRDSDERRDLAALPEYRSLVQACRLLLEQHGARPAGADMADKGR